MYDILADIFVAVVAIAYFVLVIVLIGYLLRTRTRPAKTRHRQPSASEPHKTKP